MLYALHRIGKIRAGDERSRFRCGHETPRSKQAAHLPEHLNRVLRCDHNVPLLSLLLSIRLEELVNCRLIPNLIRAACSRSLSVCTFGKHKQLDFTVAVWQAGGTTHHLVRLANVDVQVKAHLHRLIHLYSVRASLCSMVHFFLPAQLYQVEYVVHRERRSGPRRWSTCFRVIVRRVDESWRLSRRWRVNRQLHLFIPVVV
mmetsp:Transcript_7051/g.18243  ORF Transcript_7051/g.18243 Transcript_7051/m.18243 type:complete len:201 (-) Transcript_7051:13-615(-)